MRVSAENFTNCAPNFSTSRPRRLNFSFASTTMDRPSGVSSARLASWAASARVSRLMPVTGTNSVAMRLPSVMVPVLSSNKVSTSPAASMARPLMAMTFLRIRRSMPAMPMAESKPPMVVGIRQTSSATMTVADSLIDEYAARGTNVTQANKNTMVMPTSRMCSAISLGVFCRLAPSTSAIMRSRKVWPGSDVMRTTMRSERTRVPPVTAERSPPLSRITGADSPVIADSSTEATPSMTSPSPGTSSPASITTKSPARSESADTVSSGPLGVFIFRALVCVRILRRLAACALPRPSATASAKLAKITVNHSQSEMLIVNHSGAERDAGTSASRNATSVVKMLPISTTNMTGLRMTLAGDSLRRLSFAASFRMALSNSETACAWGRIRKPFRPQPRNAQQWGRETAQGRT